VLLLAIALVAAFARLLAPYGENFIDQVHWQGYPLAPGVGGHLLGTDENGRDLLTRLMFGAQVTLAFAVSAVLIEVVIGTLFGVLSGCYDGYADYWIMRLGEAFSSIPTLPLLLVLSTIVAARLNGIPHNLPAILVVMIGVLSWPAVARIARDTFHALRAKEFAEAARAVGNGDARIILRHLLPNALAPIIVQATLDLGGIILLESTLSFLGFGIQPPTPSWGNMLVNAESIMRIAPWIAILPSLCIIVTVLSINYLGDGLRDALDPNMR
jgi:peptide/nickel transport system permease protein